VKAAGTTQLSRLAYAVDAVQNLTGLSEQHATSDPTGAYAFGYDAANRLTSASYAAAYGFTGNQAYVYDPAGNREDPADASLYAYDANNRLTARPGIPSYTFDDDGNLTARTGESFSYDFTNRLRSFTRPPC
jgi:YD repeat-containing protein